MRSHYIEFVRQFRAPEEYKVEALSEKVDVFSLGNTIYSIITGIYPFDKKEYSEKETKKRVKNGEKPPLKAKYRESENPIYRVLVKAMDMSLIYRWQDRARAYEVRDMFVTELRDVTDYYALKSQVRRDNE